MPIWDNISKEKKLELLKKYLRNESIHDDAIQLGYRNEDSLRRRLSDLKRLLGYSDTSNDNKLRRATDLSEYEPDLPSVRRQKEIVKRSHDNFNLYKRRMRQGLNPADGMTPNTDGLYRLAFISDVHIPYQHNEALDIFCKIIQDYKPHFVTGLNDVFDFAEYSTRWEDDRSLAARLWSSDIQKAIDAHKAYVDMINSAHKAIWLGLNGNHDKRVIKYLKETSSGYAEKAVADWMAELESQGVMQFSVEKENVIQLSPGLKIIHGLSASKNQSTVAKNTIEALRGRNYDEDHGVHYNVIYGHDHRCVYYPHNGVESFGSGCMCNPEPHYLDQKPNWDIGFVLCSFDPHSRRIDATIINIFKSKGKWQAWYNGKKYEAS